VVVQERWRPDSHTVQLLTIADVMSEECVPASTAINAMRRHPQHSRAVTWVLLSIVHVWCIPRDSCDAMQRLEGETDQERGRLEAEYRGKEQSLAAKHSAALKEAKKSEARFAEKFRQAAEAGRAAEDRAAAAEQHLAEMRRELAAKNDRLRWFEEQASPHLWWQPAGAGGRAPSGLSIPTLPRGRRQVFLLWQPGCLET
jgi:hypothetical protein